MKKRSLLWALGLLIVATLIAGCFYYWEPILISMAKLKRTFLCFELLFEESIQAHPMGLLSAMALLPALGCPISILCFLGGVAYGFQTAFGLLAVGLFFNLALTYWLASRLLGSLVQRLVLRFGYQMPQFSPNKQLQFIFFMRIAPMPTFLRNYILGTFRVKFLPYMLLSFPFELLWTAGFILSGDALISGHFRTFFLAIFLVIVLMVAVRWIRKRYTPHAG